MLVRWHSHGQTRDKRRRRLQESYKALKGIINNIRQANGLVPTGDAQYIFDKIKHIKPLSALKHWKKGLRRIFRLAGRAQKEASRLASQERAAEDK